MVLPSLLLAKTNKYLNTFSPNYSFHINDLDISFFRGAYRFEEVIGRLKSSGEIFLTIKTVDISMAWRELFKGRILTDIKIDHLDFLVIKDIEKLSSLKKESKEAKETLMPVEIERVDLMDSSIAFENYKSISDNSNLKITQLNGSITNLTPTQKMPISYFNLRAKLIDMSSIFHLVGELKSLNKPIVWKIDAEVRDFKITSLNPYLKKHMPLTFTAGTLDLYSEMKSEKGKVEGYVKPFLREIDVIANKEHFISAKHLGIEIVTAIINLVLRESKTKSVATVIDFTYDKKLTIKKTKAAGKALEHGFEQQISPGIEGRYHLN